MTATSTRTVNTANQVSEQVEALSRVWDDYLYPPTEMKPWLGLARIDQTSKRLLQASKAILINVLPAVIPLQILICSDALDWTNLALDALLVLEVGPCRILTRLVDRIAPYPQEGVSEILPETKQIAIASKCLSRRRILQNNRFYDRRGRAYSSRT